MDAEKLAARFDKFSGPEWREAATMIREQAAEIERMRADLKRYSMSAGMADQYRAEAKAARIACGFAEDSEEVSPSMLTEHIERLRMPEPVWTLKEHGPGCREQIYYTCSNGLCPSCGKIGERVHSESLIEENARLRDLPNKQAQVLWADDATPFTAEQVREMLRENERLRSIIANYCKVD